MRNCNELAVLLLIVNGIFLCVGQLLVKTYRHCDPNIHYACFHNFTFRTIDHKQYMDGIAILSSSFDNTISANASLEVLIGQRYVYMTSIYERKACNSVHKYFGEFIYDMERAGQVIPGMCPIAEGRYQWHNYLLDFEKVTTLANFPFGNLRFNVKLFDKKNALYSCIIFEVQHSTYVKERIF